MLVRFQNHLPSIRKIQGEEVQVNIETFEVMKGRIGRRALVLVLEWAALHRDDLLRASDAASRNQEPDKIEPLD